LLARKRVQMGKGMPVGKEAQVGKKVLVRRR
jgi:hypothetical protein